MTTTKYHQLSLKESFSDCQEQFIEDTPSFFILLSEFFFGLIKVRPKSDDLYQFRSNSEY